MNTTALTASFQSERFFAHWLNSVIQSKKQGFPAYINNRKGSPVLRVEWTQKGLIVRDKKGIIPRNVWIKALVKVKA